jgi:hypothetical protein
MRPPSARISRMLTERLQYLQAVQTGTEPFTGSANLVISSYSVSVTTGSSTTPPASSPTSSPTTSPTTAPSPAPSGSVGHYGQCGGTGYKGATTCVSRLAIDSHRPCGRADPGRRRRRGRAPPCPRHTTTSASEHIFFLGRQYLWGGCSAINMFTSICAIQQGSGDAITEIESTYRLPSRGF